MPIRTLLIIILIIVLIVALLSSPIPVGGWHGMGWGPSGLGFVVLIIIVVLLLRA